ncbi:hypothetical protein L596_007216 [Steinernema carpocapsae]|uniref:TAFH domain-containing protein n=1 Tax=Steinernema carpocapsae TaxID=34508 RepID=A0A4U5P9A3_STECR|nr:hypothetical protein L596_007216 [Steinernema carpocapsae]
MNGSAGTQGQNLPKFRIVPGRHMGEVPGAPGRSISRTSSWSSNSNSQDGSLLNQSRPSNSTISPENVQASGPQGLSQVQSVSFANIKEESRFYASPSPSSPSGALRYGQPSTSTTPIGTVNVNGNHGQAQPASISYVQQQQPVVSINGSLVSGAPPSIVSQMPQGQQVQATAVSSSGVRYLSTPQVQYVSNHQIQPGNSNLSIQSSVQQPISRMQQPVSVNSVSAPPQSAAVLSNQNAQMSIIPGGCPPPGGGQGPSSQDSAGPLDQQSLPSPNQDQAVLKCAKFFRTLISISQPDKPIQVVSLVREVIMGVIEVEQFTTRLQKALVSKAQPNLQPFLQKTLPSLKEKMRREEVVVDNVNLSRKLGIMPDEPQALTFASPEGLPSTSGSGPQGSQARILQLGPSMMQQQPNQQLPGQHYHSPSPHMPRPDSTGQLIQRNVSMGGISGSPSPASTLNTPPPNNGAMAGVVKMEPKEPSTPASVSSHLDGRMTPCASGPIPTTVPVSSVASAQSVPPLQPPATSAPSTSTAAPPEQIQTKPFTNVQMLAQYRVLSFDVLLSRIRKVMDKVHTSSAQPDVLPADDQALTLIGQAAEYRLRKVITHLSTTAEHRSEQLRSNPLYKMVDDPRKQLKFVEEIERQEQEKRENREKEALIRMSKSKGKDKDTLEKAKQIQQADQLAARTRDANAAALAALGGGSRKRNADDPLDQSIAHGLSFPATKRPRTKRVLVKDLMLILGQDDHMKNSKLKTRLLYCGLSSLKDQPL